MKFDTVIGNPPYNKGMDLDFVDLGFKLCKQNIVVIIPAKWQTTADNYTGCASKNINYKMFREKYTKYISTICFYPCCKDIFNILQVDGITYLKMDKNITHRLCNIINKSKYLNYINSTTYRNISNKESLLNIGNEIVEYLGNYTIFKFPKTDLNKKYAVWTNSQVPGGGFSTLQSNRKTLFIGDSIIEENLGLILWHSGSTKCTFTSDNIQECKSFISYINTKLVQFTLAMNACKLNSNLTNDNFRFVPAPPIKPDKTYNFDIIYTDEIIYEYFGLDKQDAQTTNGVRYIDIIESIVKERK
jgi:hypothetical protein